MRLRALALVAVLPLTACTAEPPARTGVVGRAPAACAEAFEHVAEVVREYDSQLGLTGTELLDSRERARAALDRYDAAKAECLAK